MISFSILEERLKENLSKTSRKQGNYEMNISQYQLQERQELEKIADFIYQAYLKETVVNFTHYQNKDLYEYENLYVF